MATRHEPRRPNSMCAVSTVPESHLRSPARRVRPQPLPIRSTVKRPHPQVGDTARLWHYVESEWIEGKIESIEPGYRVLVQCREGLEETVGWQLALREGTWVEDVAGMAAIKT
jgi:hypothetical protein